MTTTGRSQALIPVLCSFFVIGFVDLVGVVTGYVRLDFNLSDTMAQFLPGMVFIWFAILAIPTGLMQDRMGQKNTVVLGMLITILGLITPWLYYSYWTVLSGFAVLGMGNTILQVAANPLLVNISKSRDESANLSLSQFVKATASLLGPVIIALFVTTYGDWRLVFPLYALFTLVMAIWLYGVEVPEKSFHNKPHASLGSTIRLLKDHWIRMIIVGTALIVGFDVGFNSNIVRFMMARFELDLEDASYAISLYFASLMTGRFIGSLLLRKINENIFLMCSVLLCILSLLCMVFIKGLFVNWILIFLAGLGFSNVFPQIFSLILKLKPTHTNELSGLIILSISGGALIPPIMGLLTDLIHFTWIIWLLIICMIYVFIASLLLFKKLNTQ